MPSNISSCTVTVQVPCLGDRRTGKLHFDLSQTVVDIKIYIYAFSRRFYPKRLLRESFTKEHKSLIITTRWSQTLLAAKT